MDAPVQGSGKTLLASCVAALGTGHVPEIWPHTAGRDDEELRKRLFAALRDGTSALIWDNITGVFDSAALASAITAPVYRDRVLGRSESLNIPNRGPASPDREELLPRWRPAASDRHDSDRSRNG